MVTLATNNPTLADVAKGLDPDGSVAQTVEILNQTNEMLLDGTFIEGNLPTGHRTSIRSGLPTPTWRKLYGGVQPTKSTKVQVTDNCGMLEDYAEVDKALADLNGNTMSFRLSEDKAHIEGINQEVAQTLIYGNEGSARLNSRACRHATTRSPRRTPTTSSTETARARTTRRSGSSCGARRRRT
jgi:hypothetical protein